MQSVTLIIDKRRELSTKYKKLLAGKHNKCLISKNLISAMKTIQELEPDLIIISDSNEGELADYCKQIRALTYNMRPIIVATSKSAEFNDKIKVLENGADDFISEPVNSEEFTMRMKAHLRREYETNIDTKCFLPGKNYSLRILKRTLNQKLPWACLLVSIENFDNYKETYTELASDKLIQTYSAIIRSTLNENDYLGSISEKEFLIVTDPLKAEKIANFLTFAFDSVAAKFYSAQDNKRGYMIMRGDEFAGRRSDFVHTTIGVVTNEFIQYKDTTSLINALQQIHRMADLPSKSNYLIERPRITAEDAINENSYNNKILIIENDEAMKLLLTTILNLQGYEAATANSPEAAAYLENSPALIILDAGTLEKMEGLDICRRIKQNDRFNKTKIIVTSIIHDKELILSAGADLYIPRPYEISSLIKWVELFIKEINS